MKIKRYKKFQGSLKFFVTTFELQPPFSILVDGTFARLALQNKVNLSEQLKKYFDDEVRVVTSPCCMLEVEKLGPTLYGALQVLKSLQMVRCPHAKSPVPAVRCVTSLILEGKKKNEEEEEPEKTTKPQYIAATEDHLLRRRLRRIPGVPILYFAGAAPTLEKPSKASHDWVEKEVKKKLGLKDHEKKNLAMMKAEMIGSDSKEEKNKGTKKRKVTGPNPLSCKKSKKKKKNKGPKTPPNPTPSNDANANKKKGRRRVKIKVPKHVKEELNKAFLIKPKKDTKD